MEDVLFVVDVDSISSALDGEDGETQIHGTVNFPLDYVVGSFGVGQNSLFQHEEALVPAFQRPLPSLAQVTGKLETRA